MKCLSFCPILTTLGTCRQISAAVPNAKVHENLSPVGAFVPWRRTKTPKLTAAFHSYFANASKKVKLLYKKTNITILLLLLKFGTAVSELPVTFLFRMSSTLKMETAGSSETFKNIYHTTRRHSQMAVFILTTFSTSNLTYLEHDAYLALRDSEYKKHVELRRFLINNPLRYY